MSSTVPMANTWPMAMTSITPKKVTKEQRKLLEEQARLLKITPTTPLLSVERVAFTYNDVPMELRRGLYLTDTHHYRNELS